MARGASGVALKVRWKAIVPVRNLARRQRFSAGQNGGRFAGIEQQTRYRTDRKLWATNYGPQTAGHELRTQRLTLSEVHLQSIPQRLQATNYGPRDCHHEDFELRWKLNMRPLAGNLIHD